jgi:hypothetical protein
VLRRITPAAPGLSPEGEDTGISRRWVRGLLFGGCAHKGSTVARRGFRITRITRVPHCGVEVNACKLGNTQYLQIEEGFATRSVKRRSIYLAAYRAPCFLEDLGPSLGLEGVAAVK